jgi:hypothetical protein
VLQQCCVVRDQAWVPTLPGDRSTQCKNLICSGHGSIYYYSNYHYHLVRNPPLRPAISPIRQPSRAYLPRGYVSQNMEVIMVVVQFPSRVCGLPQSTGRHRAGSSSFLLQSQFEGIKIFASSFGCLPFRDPFSSFFLHASLPLVALAFLSLLSPSSAHSCWWCMGYTGLTRSSVLCPPAFAFALFLISSPPLFSRSSMPTAA